MDNGLDGARNKQDRPKPSFDVTRPEDYVEFVESLWVCDPRVIRCRRSLS